MLRQCIICDKLYEVPNDDKSVKVCSSNCFAQYLLMSSSKNFNMKLATCGNCGNQFWAKRRNQKYCSDSCRYAAGNSRKKTRQQLADSDVRKLAISEKYAHKKYTDKRCRVCNKKLTVHMLMEHPDDEVCSYECAIKYKERLKLKANSNSTKAVSFHKTETDQPSHTSRTVADDIKEMREWQRRRRAREFWKKVPVEVGASLCKKYNISYGEYQTLKYTGKWDEFVRQHERIREDDDDGKSSTNKS